MFCLKCCTDEDCPVHKEQREQVLWKEQVMKGMTPQQKSLRDQVMKKQIPKGRFREPGFTYLGDTVILWSLQEYFNHPKWKEDAIRKSQKRNQLYVVVPTTTTPQRRRRGNPPLTTTTTSTTGRIPSTLPSNNYHSAPSSSSSSIRRCFNNRRKKRFHRIVEQLYQQSLQK